MLRNVSFLLAVVTIAAGFAAPAAAQTTATTNVSINIPSFVMLYYRADVSFDVGDSVMAALIGEGSNPADEGGTTVAFDSSFAADAGVSGTATGFTALGSATATVSNFWGVRSLAPVGGSTQVSVSFPSGGDTLSNSTDSITLTGLETDVSGGSFGGASVSFGPTGLGGLPGGLQLGDVRFNVNLGGVSTSGSYTGGQIEVTAQNI